MSNEAPQKALTDITNVSLDVEEEKYLLKGETASRTGYKYTLSRNQIKITCPYKVQDWKNNTTILAGASDVAHKPTCNSDCALFFIRAEMDNIGADGMTNAHVRLMCGCAPVQYTVSIMVGKPKPESNMRKA